MSNNALFDDADDENQAECKYDSCTRFKHRWKWPWYLGCIDTPAAAEAQAPAQEEQPAADNPYAQAAAQEATPAQAEEVK